MRIKRTIAEFNEGDFIADAHDGITVDGLRVVAHTKFRMDNAAAVMQLSMHNQGIDKTYINKLIVILDIGLSGTINAMYAYDDRYLGVVSYQRET
jgi:hypothetical protein